MKTDKIPEAREPVGFGSHDHGACIRTMLQKADEACAARGLQFTPARRRTLEILLEAHTAMGAYDVLARLAQDGLGSKPPVAYRALGFLVDNGFAHRIERLNAFVACAVPDDGHDPAFLICRSCGTVAETRAAPMEEPAGGFRVESTTVEAEGLCPGCQDAPC